MTQTHKHTPGPWETSVDDFGTSNTGGPYVGVYDDFGKTLAHVLCRDIVGSGGENPYAANARLIAAAPDLLEALEQLTRQANKTHLLGAVTGPHWTHLGIATQKARAAIAKARDQS